MTTLTASPSARLWPAVWKLLRLRWVIVLSQFRRASLRRKIGQGVLAAIILGALGGAFALSWSLLRFLQSPELGAVLSDPSAFVASIPVLVVSAVGGVTLISSFGVLLQALYLAGDMDFLLSKPVPIRAIFIAKLIQAILPNFSLVLLFGLPVLFGLGASAGYNFLYYPLVLLVLILLGLAAAGLASLLVMVIVRLVPARRVAEILGFFAAIFSMICSQSGQFANFGETSPEQAAQAIEMITRFDTSWSPLAWAGRGLVDIGQGSWLSGGTLVFLTIGLAGGIFAVCLATAERLYFTGWASVQVSFRKKRRALVIRRESRMQWPFSGWIAQVAPQSVRGILSKDFRMLRRDLRNMSQLVTPLIFGILYGFLLIRSGGEPPAGRGEAPEAFMSALGGLMAYGNVAIALFVSWSMLSRLAMMGFSQEGRQYWMLKTAPISPNRLLAAKYLVSVLPTLALGGVFLLGISLLQRMSGFALLFSFLVLVLVVLGLAGLSLAFGVLSANFNWEDPRRISQGGMGCLGSLAGALFLLLSLVLFFGPLLLSGSLGASPLLGQGIGLGLGGLFCLAGGFIPLWLVRKRIPQLGEE
ncbi:MAG: hypothetical protein MUE67_06025 [Anaerolineales bacterium]|nr:hypothetical protein [Anaerolineales bacterium]